jgi:hypothetical protein
MPCYIVSYELKQPRAQYLDFIDALKSYDDWAQILDSTWAVVTNKSAVEVRDQLWEFLDPDDGIFVLESGSEAAWQDVRCENQWLRDTL